MKAEERKELETNILADRLGKMWQSMKSGSRSIYIWLGVILVIVVGYVGYRWYAAGVAEQSARMWYNLATADNVRTLEDITRDAPESLQGLAARQQRARHLLNPEGLQILGSTTPEVYSRAVRNIEKARSIFKELGEQWGDQPILRAEAYLGAAQAEEALVGIPQKDGETTWRGSLEEAARYYRKAAEVTPGTELADKALKRAEEIETNGEQIEQFYAGLYIGRTIVEEPATDQ